MAKFALRKLIPTVVGMGIFAPISYFVYQEYIKSSTYSNFEVAADRLGFNGYKKADKYISASEQQEALLTLFQIAGYFQT